MHALQRLLSIMIAAILGCSLWSICQADDQKNEPAKQPPQKSLVAQKLEHAQKVLEAVAQNDYSMVAQHSEELIRISKDLSWQRIRSDKYEVLGKEYRRELEFLIKAAKAKNNEAMALGYVKMSLSCFDCHNHVREVKVSGQ